jgi:hypothetical protein
MIPTYWHQASAELAVNWLSDTRALVWRRAAIHLRPSPDPLSGSKYRSRLPTRFGPGFQRRLAQFSQARCMLPVRQGCLGVACRSEKLSTFVIWLNIFLVAVLIRHDGTPWMTKA